VDSVQVIGWMVMGNGCTGVVVAAADGTVYHRDADWEVWIADPDPDRVVIGLIDWYGFEGKILAGPVVIRLADDPIDVSDFLAEVDINELIEERMLPLLDILTEETEIRLPPIVGAQRKRLRI